MITFQPSDRICDLVSILFKACKNTPQVMFLFFFHNKLLKVLLDGLMSSHPYTDT